MDIFEILHVLGWAATIVSQSGIIPDPHVNETLLRAGLLAAGGSNVTAPVVKKMRGK